jgi:hypothetical protein
VTDGGSPYHLISAACAANATTYTSDPTHADFTAGVNQYATFSNFGAGDTSSPYTPTATTLNSDIRGTARRVVGGSWMWG